MFRAPLCPSSGARKYYTDGHCLWYLVFKLLVWCGAEGCVSGLRAVAQQPANRTHNPPHHTDNLKTKTPNTTGSNYLYNTLELLMMGIMVPETCWASNKICNKNHLLHLVGILFPNICCSVCGLQKTSFNSFHWLNYPSIPTVWKTSARQERNTSPRWHSWVHQMLQWKYRNRSDNAGPKRNIIDLLVFGFQQLDTIVCVEVWQQLA